MSDQPQDLNPEDAADDVPVEGASEDHAQAAAHATASSEHDNQDPMQTQEMLHVDRYEGTWMRISAVVIAIFFIAVVVSAFAVGFQLPGVYERIDPETLYDPGSPYADPGLRELAPGKYELFIRAQMWSYAPNEVEIPVGSEVTFYITSQDVQHGFKLQNTNINMMILPGQVSKLTAKFDTPGTYEYICHEFCGTQHHNMYGKLIVVDEQVADSEGDTD